MGRAGPLYYKRITENAQLKAALAAKDKLIAELKLQVAKKNAAHKMNMTTIGRRKKHTAELEAKVEEYNSCKEDCAPAVLMKENAELEAEVIAKQAMSFSWQETAQGRKEERDKLEAALQEISDQQDVRVTCGIGYDHEVDNIVKKALKRR